ncbi:MAG: hypothetical protein RSA79_03120 [Oscillospiraceae bacterium]
MIEFKLFGMTIRIHFLFVALVTLFLLTDEKNVAFLSLLACIIHELAHVIAFMIVSYTPIALDFEITGLRLTASPHKLSIGKELFVQVAGCLMNFILFFSFYFSLTQINSLSIITVAHLIIGIFNMLPLKSFDGGKILMLILTKTIRVDIALKICDIVDGVFLLLLFIAGVFLFLKIQTFTLFLLVCWLIFIFLMKSKKKA